MLYLLFCFALLRRQAVKRVYQPKWMWGLDRKRATDFQAALDYYHNMVSTIRKQRNEEQHKSNGASDKDDDKGDKGDEATLASSQRSDMLSAMIRARDRETGLCFCDFCVSSFFLVFVFVFVFVVVVFHVFRLTS